MSIIPPLDQPDPVIAPIGDADPSLVYKDLTQANGLHALIVGVSDYANLPDWGVAGGSRSYDMKKLRSAAISAYRMAQWLLKNQTNLAWRLSTLRVLLSPSPVETGIEPGLNASAAFQRPTLQNVANAATAWRTSADRSVDGATFFFFSGHGLQLSNESTVLLFDDFGQAVGKSFLNSTELSNIVGGMNQSVDARRVPNTQFYFVDACRLQLPSGVSNPDATDIFDERPGPDTRSRPIYFATAGGMAAYGDPGQHSYFTRALLTALDTGVDRPTILSDGKLGYPITVPSLATRVAQVLTAEGLPQGCYLGGVQKPGTVLRTLTSPPMVKFQIEIQVQPPAAIPAIQILLRDFDGNLVGTYGPPPPHPIPATIPMGTYSLEACTPPGASPQRKATGFPVSHDLTRWTVRM
jgi:hypothetical protein